MECKSRLKSIFRDFRTGRFLLTLELEGVTSAQLEGLDDKDLRLTLKKWREKRSLAANAYMWVLVTKIAMELKSTPEEIYEQFIMDYSLPEQDENGYVVITVRGDVDMSRIPGHWKFYQASGDWKWKSYVKMMGSSDFDTKMMSDFLDVVIDQAESLGIETATPDEIERMKQSWGVNTGASSRRTLTTVS